MVISSYTKINIISFAMKILGNLTQSNKTKLRGQISSRGSDSSNRSQDSFTKKTEKEIDDLKKSKYDLNNLKINIRQGIGDILETELKLQDGLSQSMPKFKKYVQMGDIQKKNALKETFLKLYEQEKLLKSNVGFPGLEENSLTKSFKSALLKMVESY